MHKVSFYFHAKGNQKSSHGRPNAHTTSFLRITAFSDRILRGRDPVFWCGAKFLKNLKPRAELTKTGKILRLHVCKKNLI